MIHLALLLGAASASAQLRPEARYPEFYGMAVSNAAIPGLERGVVPQGAAWARKMALVSYYSPKGAGLAAVDFDGVFHRHVALNDTGGKPLRSHAGGLAASKNSLWLASGGKLTRFSLSAFFDGREPSLNAESQFPVETKASFVSASDDGLWVGDFHGRKDGAQAFAAFYPLDDEERPRSRPTRLWTIPDRVQGLAVCSGFVALSRSGGPKDSTLELHRPPADGGLIGEATLLRRVVMPAGAEDLECVDGKLLIVFESAALRYRDAWLRAGAGVEDRVFLLSLKPAD